MSDENTDPRSEPGIGGSLERARQSRGISLREVEQRTRIRSRYLRDLEREDFDVLPAVYVLGSLKTYADFLGLDGANLSRQLKARLTEPEEAEVHQAAGPEGAQEDEDGFEAARVPTIGFDQLFLGMGVILISILAIMTLAAAVAQGDRSPVSQVDQPSTPEPPSEVALAGNTQAEEKDPAPDTADATDGKATDGKATDGKATDKGDEPKDAPEPANGGEGEEDQQDKEDGGSSQGSSPFGDAEFVPISPSSPPAEPFPTASAVASAAASAASASASLASATAEPATAEPATAEPEAAGPEGRPISPAPASAEASPRPVAENRAPAPAPPPDAPAPAPARAQGSGQPSPPASGAGPIPVEAANVIDETFRLNGPE